MNIRRAWIALAAAPFLLRSAAEDSIRGFDSAGQADEIRWERQARSIPDAERIRALIERLSDKPHMAGTPQSKQTAEFILARLREFGLDAHIEEYQSVLPTPRARLLEMTEPVSFRARLEEPPIAGDRNSADSGMVPAFNAFSGDGDVTAPLVYVNYGIPADYEILKQNGIDVRGRIVLARYGGSWRGIKPKVAFEHGAAGCIIYSDPRDDGFFQGDVFPRGPYRPAGGVQRGSVLDMVLYPGDPLSPGWAAEPGAKRLPLSEAATFMKIPVLPISYEDAQPLLASLDGPVAPEAWRGALPVTYHLGGGRVRVHLKVAMDNSTHPLYDVIARIPGSDLTDQWVMYGNHHDAWVHGASDPLSGAVPLIETARTFGELLHSGWKPRRTILLAFWDAEEYGLIGSTEYMEKHADELSDKLAVYVNSDSSGKGRLNIGGSHSLEGFSEEIARDVADPASGRSLLTELMDKKQTRSAPVSGEFHIAPLGSGSDYTPFLQHLGIASLDVRFTGEGDGGVYHSDYDDFYWFSRFGDPGFIYSRALAQVNATVLMRLADSALLPFEFGPFIATVGRYLDEIEKLPAQKPKINLSEVRAQLSRLGKSSAAFETAYGAAMPRLAAAGADKLAAIDRILFHTERDLTLDPGLPGRPWFRHRIYAPGQYTGYAVKTLPGIREAVEAGRPDEAEQQAKQVAQVLAALNGSVLQAAALLGQL